MTSRFSRVGILGGMGPAATIDFYAKLVEETPARTDQEHCPVVVWADPTVPDRTASLLGSGEDPTPWLDRGIRALAQAGCDLLVVPCNTAHAFVTDLADRAGIELVSLIDAAADDLAESGLDTAGLLATSGTLMSGLYTDALSRRGIRTVEPEECEQSRVMSVIRAVKAGEYGCTESEALTQVSQRLIDRGAQTIVAACTEIVLAIDERAVKVPVADPARALARRVIQVVQLDGAVVGA